MGSVRLGEIAVKSIIGYRAFGNLWFLCWDAVDFDVSVLTRKRAKGR